MALSNRQFKGLVDKLHTDGGFSANPTTGAAPSKGFMVAKPGHEESIPTNEVDHSALKHYTGRHAEALAAPGAHFGGWRDDSRGMVDLDVAQQVKPRTSVSAKYGPEVAYHDARTSALDLSIARNQRAAYDLNKGEDLKNPDFQEPKASDRR